MIDVSGLSHVLEVDAESKTVLVEPNVPMDQLVEATLKYGLIPPVVMEFPGITVGGGFAGTGGESSSFKYGLFDVTVNWIEIVLADGQVVHASKAERHDLFYGAAGTFGTLGVTTLLELRLLRATTHVELTYNSVASFPEAIQKLRLAEADPSNDFVDGVLFAKDRGVVVVGRLKNISQNDTSIRIQRFSRARDPWFYLHAEQILGSSTPAFKEAVPLIDYLFRYDRGGFWVGYYAFKYFKIPFNRVTRWALDKYMHTRVMYHALQESGFSQKYIIQDLALPYSTVQNFLEYIDTSFGFYPLWLCLLRPSGQTPLHPHSANGRYSKKQETLLNVGLWGPGPSSHDAFVQANRQLEHKVRELFGMKWLYAQTYYTEEEFWDIYDRKWYEALRIKYHATTLPSVYDKVKIDLDAQRRRSVSGVWAIWPRSGLYGVAKAVIGSDYILSTKGRDVRGLGCLFGVLVLLLNLLTILLWRMGKVIWLESTGGLFSPPARQERLQ
ncbi:fad-binding protein [Lasallia pustulata]|uniref:Delta(24)-sterol reductase n=1 Tax=Lasallia pustulata TaxID=136370 RepID=A0A1W5CVB8_9LECA|nr:fad-binding protein [Lasallia pustulata]